MSVIASSVLAVVLMLGLATPATGLVCARPWGGDAEQGARMALGGELGAGEFDGFIVGRVTAVHGDEVFGRSITVEVAAAFELEAGQVEELGLSAHGPSGLATGQFYFLPVFEPIGDEGSLFVHPCGPMFVASGESIDRLMAEFDSGRIVSAELMADLRAGAGTGASSLILPGLAVAALFLAIAVFRTPRRSLTLSRSPSRRGTETGAPDRRRG